MKKYKGIRYRFRPASYREDLNPLGAILRNVTGENRREIIRRSWKQGKLEVLPLGWLEDVLDEESRAGFGRIHPSFMGGEYLPGYLRDEVEIARICLRSTTSDVISLRARPDCGGIVYRVVDEYDGEFKLPIGRSVLPLTLAQLIRQFEEGEVQELKCDEGMARAYNARNAEHCDPKDLRHFTRISSDIYPQLEAHFEQVFEEWVQESRARMGAVESKDDK